MTINRFITLLAISIASYIPSIYGVEYQEQHKDNILSLVRTNLKSLPPLDWISIHQDNDNMGLQNIHLICNALTCTPGFNLLDHESMTGLLIEGLKLLPKDYHYPWASILNIINEKFFIPYDIDEPSINTTINYIINIVFQDRLYDPWMVNKIQDPVLDPHFDDQGNYSAHKSEQEIKWENTYLQNKMEELIKTVIDLNNDKVSDATKIQFITQNVSHYTCFHDGPMAEFLITLLNADKPHSSMYLRMLMIDYLAKNPSIWDLSYLIHLVNNNFNPDFGGKLKLSDDDLLDVIKNIFNSWSCMINHIDKGYYSLSRKIQLACMHHVSQSLQMDPTRKGANPKLMDLLSQEEFFDPEVIKAVNEELYQYNPMVDALFTFLESGLFMMLSPDHKNNLIYDLVMGLSVLSYNIHEQSWVIKKANNMSRLYKDERHLPDFIGPHIHNHPSRELLESHLQSIFSREH